MTNILDTFNNVMAGFMAPSKMSDFADTFVAAAGITIASGHPAGVALGVAGLTAIGYAANEVGKQSPLSMTPPTPR